VKKNHWLDEFLDATEKSLGAMDLATLQPTSWRHVQPLAAAEWLDWFYRIMSAQKEKKVSFKQLARFFPPDLCREHLFFTLEDLKVARWPKKKRLEVADFFYQLLRAQMEPNDLFGFQGTTKPKLDVFRVMEKKFQVGTPHIARNLGKLYNAAYNLGAALYLDYYMGNAIENYGPYSLEGNRILVVKVMRHLRPKELWPNKSMPADSITLYCVYENVTFNTDLIACHTQYGGDPIHGLKSWRLEIDGKTVDDMQEVNRMMAILAENAKTQWKKILALTERELIQKSIQIRCFIFKPLCDALELDWKPTFPLLAAVKGKTLADGWNTWKHPKTVAMQKAYWRKTWDPRLDVYPNSLV
jgi:hypothetical protein